ncbi:ABC transporter ATP-binding protein [Marinobacter sp. LV10MA510-1]|uniref:ABC transporter ATP-binding protein n=1 Tax=Marinobacter sp. LV10MA510-1 TaxID=1415567 RepID=UPI000BF3B9A6|nr:ATP-binding cassette domain-containing protein [Marinobacter sp. LV10MA510-1]PFG09380.1 branched-chain amino acid transport system ATP-binding protein [Marinobacter sp. LV10MA510-1]
MLKLENVSARIDNVEVLRNISVDLPAGSIVAVVGRNGAGKTTLLKAVMGLLRLEEGDISFDGQSLSRVKAHERVLLGIGYAPQERVMFPSMSVEENLRFPCQIARYSKAQIDESLKLTLEIVPQLEELLPRSGAALSGGQGKMAALGRALMVGSHMVLLDEPFQGLAPALAAQYSDALQRLHQKMPDLSIVITESNAGLLKDIPDKVMYIERGALLPEPAASESTNQSAVGAQL